MYETHDEFHRHDAATLAGLERRHKARALIGKLLALADPSRGGTPGECAAARGKAELLMSKYGISKADAQCEVTIITTAERSGGEEPFFGQRRGPTFPQGWSFDIRTGQASAGVKVHRYNGPRDWKIEIPLS